MLEYIELYIKEFIQLSLEMAPWLMLGFFFAGLLHVFMPKGSVSKYMGKPSLKSAVNASVLGIPLPLCSCGVIPTGISFYREGASRGSSVSFLISTPQTGIDSILATYALLGLPCAIVRPIVAFFSGIFGGALTNRLAGNEAEKKVAEQEPQTENHKKPGKIRKMLRYAYYDFLMDIANWLIIGLAIAALISVLLPDDFFTLYIQNEYLSMLIVLAASIPIYVCATGSIPIAAVLMLKGLSPGAALVFLMAGPATNTATIAVISRAMGKRTVLLYLSTIILSAIFFGALINELLPREWFIAGLVHPGHEHTLLPWWLMMGSGIALAALIIYGYMKKYHLIPSTIKRKERTKDVEIIKIKVKGMTCNHCKITVEKALGNIVQVKEAEADIVNSTVTLKGDNIDLNKAKDIVEESGYQYEGRID